MSVSHHSSSLHRPFGIFFPPYKGIFVFNLISFSRHEFFYDLTLLNSYTHTRAHTHLYSSLVELLRQLPQLSIICCGGISLWGRIPLQLI